MKNKNGNVLPKLFYLTAKALFMKFDSNQCFLATIIKILGPISSSTLCCCFPLMLYRYNL